MALYTRIHEFSEMRHSMDSYDFPILHSIDMIYNIIEEYRDF
jgi:hypothetical protein